MRALAEFTMRGRAQAVMSVTVLAILSLIIAPLSLLSGAAVALVTLRLGSREGILLISLSLLACGTLSYLIFSDILPALVFALVLWLPMWLLGMLLRVTRDLSLTVQAALVISAILAAVMYLFIGEPAKFWQQILAESMQSLSGAQDMQLSEAELQSFIAELSQWITAIVVAGYFLQLLAGLFIARWWQALIYNPGGFGEEFRALGYQRPLAVLTIPFVLLVGFSQPAEWVQTLTLLLVSAYAVIGLAVMHAVLHNTASAKFWLGGIYVLLFIAMPYVLPALAMTGFADAWVNLRRKKQSQRTEDE